MTNEADLMAAIGANSNNHDLRLMLADWYEQHGQAQRAEYIRIQVHLASKEVDLDDHKRQPLRDRAEELHDDALQSWLSELPGLTVTEITLQGGLPTRLQCQPTSDADLRYVERLRCLRWLDLRWSEQLTDAGLTHLRGLTNLELLRLGWCHRLTGSGLAHLSELNKLRVLNLPCCNQLTDPGLAHLAGLSNLRELLLLGCRQLTKGGIASLRARLPACKIIE